ncbi:aldehyde dehydrogenase family protein [Paracoccus suum]|uniref:Aldehyde dehydrogenase family protein n=1 Tax=Paracoccus suum TaxID=2259340 RepID=A0A344PMC8_9RHOB|nr:aldehyde dehydrogenase family protein [Paracoccus suum]AXC50533.1 aldehyde dehydrogenase family protein [Paracoccus suum]
MIRAKMLIGGVLCDAADGAELPTVNPATGRPLGVAPDAGPEDIRRAVDAAHAAWPAWAGLSVDARAAAMRKLAAAVRGRADEIARVEVQDTGNLLAPMLSDVLRAADRLEFYAGLGHAVMGATYPATPTHVHLSLREPFGVVARIVAFNHPFYFALSRMGAPLITGNCVIVKTPDQAPLSGGILAELAAEHLPAGVASVLSGTGARCGDAIVREPRIKRIGFIGSVETAQRIQRSAAEVGVKHITHELGGKNMMIVLPDADVEKAASLAIEGMNFQWQGQSCGSTSILALHEDIHDAVLARVRARMRAIRPGDPFDPSTGMGPLISEAHHAKITAAIARGRASGAEILEGGGRPAGAMFAKGFWVEPTLFGGVTANNALARDEFFGPVLSVLRWRDEGELIAIDDASSLGLTASIVGRDVGAALGLGRRLRVGYVWINCVGPHYVGVPYGGMKNSGVGREEGIEELLSYTEIKAISIASG